MAATTQAPTTGCGCTGTCTCSACAPLATLVRPRFFAGQVLTEVDLTALETYTMQLHRLHNQHLHGAGVVCGLELSCEDCGDGIVLAPGYALDPCGRDLVVPGPQHVDVARLIRDCVSAERRIPDCEPPLPGPPPGCDGDQRWCVTLRYKEWPMRPMTPLAGARRAARCSCGGHGHGNGNGNGNGNGCGCGCGCDEVATAPALPPGCEPTRIAECFEVGVHRCCEDDCCSLADALAGSFPVRAIACLRELVPLFTKRVERKSQLALLAVVLGQHSDPEATRTGLCDLHAAVLDLYAKDPLRTTCRTPPELAEIDCSPRGPDETDQAYAQRLAEGAQKLLLLVVAYLRECVCAALNPPCPTACDDRITLGCLTVRDGKVLDICNLQCRQYAGSFVSSRYWLPLVPAATWFFGVLCCFPLVGRTGKGRKALDTALRRADPSGELRRLMVDSDFAVPVSYAARAKVAARRLRPTALRERLRPPAHPVNLAALEGSTTSAANTALRRAGVTVSTVKLDSADALPAGALLTTPVAEKGARLVQYVHGGRVVGFARVHEEG